VTVRVRTARGSTLCLIGPMGAGKTTVGGLLARRLGCPHIDLDRLLAEDFGEPLTAVFASGRESEFRRRESRMLNAVLGGAPCVLSPGGGVVLAPRNRILLRRKATVVYLTVSEEEQRRRLAGDATRPLLGALVRSNAARLPHYAALAHLVVGTEGRTAEEVCDRVLVSLTALDWEMPCKTTG
jgi:shikimate kinase